MSASSKDLTLLANKLAQTGIAGFCPTTLSIPIGELLTSVARLGDWIVNTRQDPDFSGAFPLGIHLEGPFIAPHACGAHPVRSIRRFNRGELESLWKASHRTIKIITLAPEAISKKDISWLLKWARVNKVLLSLGHSKASHNDANYLFSHGFSGVTHAWNAMSFHHRDPGILGAALGRKNTYIELIVDGAHVSLEVIDWTLKAHHPNPVCIISDCITSGGLSSQRWHSFGPLKVRNQGGAARLVGGGLAGGGKLLSKSYRDWVNNEAKRTQTSAEQVLRNSLKHVTSDPLKILGVKSRKFFKKNLIWKLKGDQCGKPCLK